MEEHIATMDYIAAINRLYQYSQNKRYNVSKNDFVSDDIGDVAIYINERIKTKNGLDLFSIQAVKDLHLYESFLNEIAIEYAKDRIAHRDVTDESILLKYSELVSVDSLQDKNISVSAPLKDFPKVFPLPDGELIKLCYKPLTLKYFKGQPDVLRDNYLLTCKAFIKGVEYTLVVHLTDETEKKDELSIAIVFVLSTESDEKYEDAPERAFLECIDKYGLDIEINGKSKRIFEKETIILRNPLNQDFTEYFKVLNHPSTESYLVSATIDNSNAGKIDLEFVYGVNITRYLNDLDEIIGNSN